MPVTRVGFIGVFGLVLAACGATDQSGGRPSTEAAPAAGDVPGEATSDDDDHADPSAPTGGPSDDDPDRDADPNAPSPEEDPAMPPATQKQLIERFAPHVHLNPDDPNRPANVDWYLARVSMRFHHNNCPDHELLPKGKVTQAALIAQSHADNKSLCRHDDGKIAKSTTSESFFLEVADSATYAGAPRAEWKTYVVWRPKTNGLVDVEYWFFYPYNDNVAMFNHESDWEHVRVTIDPQADGGQGKALEVKMSAHHGGTIMKVPDPRLTMEGGSHPVTYSAKGTHANFPQPGTYEIEGTAGIAKDVAKAAPAADVWKTENALVLVGTRAAPKNGQVFIKFWGRWGELGDLPETNGVTRHFP